MSALGNTVKNPSERAFELPGVGQSSSRSGMAVISLAFSGTLICASTSLCGGGVGTERMHGLDPLASMVSAPGGFAVDSNERGPLRSYFGNPALEVVLEHNRIDPIKQKTQPPAARNAVVEKGNLAQEIQAMLTLGLDLAEVIAGSNRGAGGQE